ncbi:MAG: hypothetical protein A3F04_02205 [Candidatus Chisholmbacteria bacterium RIFCSPHIGHO2_12_FULL_49_9]|uniref:DNA alkylation repair protein n=1 Tax=Candidatus Chisholmbacteria bacterium RIFCSPHIGHO2_01_FULL_52_32 TaxID=1797591 RepID=A0A1G1VT57_9BACT|nr:MAG: hypothetical protein A2786_03780 [Candidatus Chisholmbacteria bacterium RIFCSPHIGHO2_01_FULL_52_32]OGY19250.1 MAG: hypothetical protein A3F04_02205 [Candidatus Chisholmbacteria bacterium RIFCSPHIGHO2_12_FULL_49_9]OGY20038.1 MAG: hypothetical protein A2900_02965 [Candidatus Chisholmbacteria bacterium RIFCSPLOWO2_01_FULL_50_28]
MNIVEEIVWFRQELKRQVNPKRAEGEKKYLKSPWKFYGVDMSRRRVIVNQWFKDHPKIEIPELEKLAEKLWDSQWHDEKTIAIMILAEKKKHLTVSHMPFIEIMIKEATGWDHLDEIAAHLVGAMIENDPKAIRYLSKWATSKNFWVRRASLLSQILLFRKGKGDHALFFKLAVPMFEEGKTWSKEERFFIRKAIGWTLRELCKSRPEEVVRFIKKYKEKMSGLTFREGSRNLPRKLQQQL